MGEDGDKYVLCSQKNIDTSPGIPNKNAFESNQVAPFRS